MQDVQPPSQCASLIRLFGLILAKLLSPLSTFALIVAIARVGGGVGLGELNTVLSWMGIFQFIAIFGMAEFISREIGKDRAAARKHITHALLCAFVLSVVCMLCMVVGAVAFQYPTPLLFALLVAGLALPFGAWGLMCHSVFIAYDRITWVALAALGECVCLLLLGLGAIHLGLGLEALMGAFVIARLVGSGIGLSMVHWGLVRLRFELDLGFLRKVIPRAAVFGLTGIAFQIYVRADIIMLSKMEAMTNVGLYSAAAKLTEVCLMLPLAFYVLNLPRAARSYATDPRSMLGEVAAIARALFIPVFFLFGVVFYCAEPILTMVFGAEFGAASWAFRILLIAFAVQSAELVMGMVCQAASYDRFTLLAALVRAFANIGLNLILIPLYGTHGAALATLFAVMASFILLQRFVKIKLGDFRWLETRDSRLATRNQRLEARE